MSKIITAADLNNFTTKTLNEGLAQQVVDGVNAFIENRTHRCWGEIKTATERYDWSSGLSLRHMDVVAITSINLGWPGQTPTLLPSSGYFVNPSGRLTFYSNLCGPSGGFWSPSAHNNDALSIVYTYGVQDVPDDLVAAALGIAWSMYNWAASGGHEVTESSVGSYRLVYSGGRGGINETEASSRSIANYSIIDSYRMRRV